MQYALLVIYFIISLKLAVLHCHWSVDMAQCEFVRCWLGFESTLCCRNIISNRLFELWRNFITTKTQVVGGASTFHFNFTNLFKLEH